MDNSAYGADLSLNHGAVVHIHMQDDSVTSVTSIYRWDSKDSHKLSLKSTPSEIYRTVREIFLAVLPPANSLVAVDFASQSVYWRTKKIFVVQMGLFMGMLYSEFKNHTSTISFVIPKDLREYFNQPATMAKQEFQEYALMLFPPPPVFLTWATEDDIDAYILAIYIILKGKQNT